MTQTALPRMARTGCCMLGMGAVALFLSMGLSGCVVAGYSSSSGFFIWPGSIVVTLVIVLLFFLLRRGR